MSAALKIAKYLRRFGWEPVIFTVKDAHYPSVDHSNDQDIPSGATILRQRIWEPYHIYKFITGQPPRPASIMFLCQDEKLGFPPPLRLDSQQLFYPRRPRAVVPPFSALLRRYLKGNPVDAIFPTVRRTAIPASPPLLKNTGIPWLAGGFRTLDADRLLPMLNLTRWGNRPPPSDGAEAFRR